MGLLTEFDPKELLFRVLEETEVNDDDVVEEPELTDGNDAQVLKDTLRVYGTFFVIVLILFSFLRRKFPRVYNLRNWVDDLKTPLAKEKHGFLITDSEMMDECGMDALCYARVLEFGLKLSCVGMLNALWLIPVYYTADQLPETDYITDPVVSISVSHLPSGSYRFCATVVGAYIIFGFTMHGILKEFEWFIMFRNQFLSKKLPRNYSVYVQNVPEEYCTNAKFLDFFQQSSGGAVFEARLAVKAPGLKKKVAQRDTVVAKLEHKINVEDVRGVTPMQISVTGPKTNAIDALFTELRELNNNISETIDLIEMRNYPRPEELASIRSAHSGDMSSPNKPLMALDYGTAQTLEGASFDELGDSNLYTENPSDAVAEQSPPGSPDRPGMLGSFVAGASKSVKKVSSAVPTAAVRNMAGNAAGLATSAVGNVANTATAFIFKEDGIPHTAGFVSFKTLRAAQAAKQLIQYPEPFAMEVLEAPQPEDVFWMNVGKDHKQLQVGKLISFGLTTVLCLLWTIPMSTIATFSSIEGLKAEVQFIADMIEKAPWLEPVLAQLAPLLIVLANEILKIILEFLSMFEGPVSGAVVEAATFSKLAAFMIIQTFFVSAISGGLLGALSNIVKEPGLAIDLLADSLPTQSTFFIQILLVDTCVSMSMELLRVTAVGMAVVRSQVGPRLTQKERETTFLGIRPLADPLEFEHASLLAGTVLYFMVFFVYSTIAPLTTFFMGICFVFMGAGYRHQFIYVYPTFPDSGGKLWASFFKIVPICMIIAEVTIVGLLALKKAAAASAMMFPLLVITILFSVYINQQHFRMTEHLPAKDCLAIDLRNNIEGEMDYEFLRDKYKQPELCERELFPENTTLDREVAQGLFGTPQNSEQGDFDQTKL
eukprot:CAMPEP_0117054938 /NCGR_PEP_ID=MMETSP0472-20121206/38072_1 /TAXON_ID=693140 ORGANISM="Tiarina fusus, Strain LIS" /NCGR_SAMPLE_ID=MMETSP0472 /ASSEMBLY_ACC=CAM_ASM_000603 /LENGTH=882 /DNA_ID=CAMNT_0004770715 /DNA_START=137 /DNA_END=2785 /DNA_ORIENTATION=-